MWRTHAADTGSYCSQAFLTLWAAVGTEEVLGQAKDPMPGDTPGRPAATAVTLQRLEALEGDPHGARHELQQPGPPLLIEGLHRLPEPPDHVAVGPAVLQPRVGLPVVQVDLVQAADDQLRGMKAGHFLDTQRDGPPRLPGRGETDQPRPSQPGDVQTRGHPPNTHSQPEAPVCLCTSRAQGGCGRDISPQLNACVCVGMHGGARPRGQWGRLPGPLGDTWGVKCDSPTPVGHAHSGTTPGQKVGGTLKGPSYMVPGVDKM